MAVLRIGILIVIVIFVFEHFSNKEETFDGVIMLPPETKILAFGDSITYGYKVPADQNYPAQLANLLFAEVINEGVSGEMSREGLRRLPAVLEKHKPDIMVLCHGGNDILRKRSMLRLKDNLIAMINLAKEQGVHVVLVGVPRVEVLTLETAAIYHEIANELGVPLQDDILTEILDDASLKLDQVHPNEQGYSRLANALANTITETYLPSNPTY